MSAAMRADSKELVVVAFPGENKAQEVLRVLRQLHRERVAELGNAAVIRRSDDGRIYISETRDFDAKEGALAGMLAGGLIGQMRGRMLAGAVVGAAAGLVLSEVLDLGFPDAYLRELAQHLAPGSSAIVAAVTFTQVERAMAALDQFDDGTILRHTLPADVARQLSAVVED